MGELGLPADRESLEAYMARNQEQRHGSHTYTAEDFGLSEVELEQDFAFYEKEMLMILKDEVVIVSGVGAGLGAKLSARAAAEGAKVVLAARSDGVTGQVVKEIIAAGGEAVAVQCDVRKEEDVERVVATAVERYGKVTGLVNAAYAHPGFTDLLETPDKQLRRAMDVIFYGALGMSACRGAAHDRRRLDRQRRHDVDARADAWRGRLRHGEGRDGLRNAVPRAGARRAAGSGSTRRSWAGSTGRACGFT